MIKKNVVDREEGGLPFGVPNCLTSPVSSPTKVNVVSYGGGVNDTPQIKAENFTLLSQPSNEGIIDIRQNITRRL